MKSRSVTPEVLNDFLSGLEAAFARPGVLHLIGETSQVYERWRSWSTRIEFTGSVAAHDQQAFSWAVNDLTERMGIVVLDESPGDVVPLPDGHEERRRAAGAWVAPVQAPAVGEAGRGLLDLYHFDPYSVAFRFLARGDEEDYHMALMFLEHEWLSLERMDVLLTALLPRFTERTIQQDPAEFRRKYRGLRQMWAARRTGFTPRTAPV